MRLKLAYTANKLVGQGNEVVFIFHPLVTYEVVELQK